MIAMPETTYTLEELGDTIRRRRLRLGERLEDVARAAGMSKPYLSIIETHRIANPPSDDVLGRIESALQLPPGFLCRRAAVLRTPPDVLALVPGEVLVQYVQGGMALTAL